MFIELRQAISISRSDLMPIVRDLFYLRQYGEFPSAGISLFLHFVDAQIYLLE